MISPERLAKKESNQRVASQVFALVSACLALVMITVGSLYWSQDYCRTGAAAYLYFAGIISFIINILALFWSFGRYWALKVGKHL